MLIFNYARISNKYTYTYPNVRTFTAAFQPLVDCGLNGSGWWKRTWDDLCTRWRYLWSNIQFFKHLCKVPYLKFSFMNKRLFICLSLSLEREREIENDTHIKHYIFRIYVRCYTLPYKLEGEGKRRKILYIPTASQINPTVSKVNSERKSNIFYFFFLEHSVCAWTNI